MIVLDGDVLYLHRRNNMRIPSSVQATQRLAVAFAVIAVSGVLLSGDKRASFSPHEKAFYAPQALVEFVNPGLAFSVVSAKIASDGTITVDYKVTDGSANNLPLDTAGIQTPGTISPRFLIAYIPKGQTQFRNRGLIVPGV